MNKTTTILQTEIEIETIHKLIETELNTLKELRQERDRLKQQLKIQKRIIKN